MEMTNGNLTIRAEGLRLIAEGLNKIAESIAEQGRESVKQPTAAAQTAPQMMPQMQQAVPQMAQQAPVYPGAVQQIPVATSQSFPAQSPVPTQAPVMLMSAQPAPVVPTTAVAQEYTQDQLAVACAGLVNQGKQPKLMQILQGFGVATLVDLPRERYGELATALRAEGAVI